MHVHMYVCVGFVHGMYVFGNKGWVRITSRLSNVSNLILTLSGV